MDPAGKVELVELANKLALQTSESLHTIRAHIAGQHGPLVAVTLTVDALIVAAISMLQTAEHEGSIPPCDTDAVLRKRLDYLLSLPDHYHHRRADGSFDPVGQRPN